MPDFKLQDGFDSETFDNSGSLGGTTVTMGTNAKGSWAQLAAATTRDASALIVTLFPGSPGLVDIGIGAAGSEVVLVPNLYTANVGNSVSYVLPVAVPSGVRLAARGASTGAVTVGVGVILLAEGLAGQGGYSRVTDYGTGTNSGTSITSSTTSGTKGSWTQLTASTTNNASALAVVFTAVASASAIRDCILDLGVGAAGSEVALVTDLPYREPIGGNNQTGVATFTLPVQIPSGTRIAARLAANAGGIAVNSTVAVYGIE